MTRDSSAGSDGQHERLCDLFERLTDRLPHATPQEIQSLLRAEPLLEDELRQVLPLLHALATVSRDDPATGNDDSTSTERPTEPKAHEATADRDSRLHKLLEERGLRVIREIGRGGMGIVYQAEQRTLARTVAVKVLPPHLLNDPIRRTRFRHEAFAAAQLQHPNIVDIHSVHCEDALHYYVMRFVDGRDLAGWLREEASSKAVGEEAFRDIGSRARWVAELGRQAAESLAYAHAAGVIHRDIKPSNLLVEPSGHLWITDFGLAQVEDLTALTQSGTLLGTLRYMSPEQLCGNREVLDHRTDIYSLGVTLIELLVGPSEPNRPAGSAATHRGSPVEWSGDQAYPPGSLRRQLPGLPVDLETILLKCVGTLPTERYATAEQLADDLQAFLEHRPIQAKPPTWRVRCVKWIRRHRRATAAVAGTFALGGVLVIATLFLWMRERQARFYEQQIGKQQAAVLRENDRLMRNHQYAVEIQLASRAWQSLQPGLAAEHLKRCVREDGDRDLRGFEWHYIDALLNSTPSPMARHDGEAYYIDFSADGRWMATCGSDGMRVFETDRWREVSHLQGHRSDVNSASFSPSGRWLVSAGDDATAIVWDVERWQPHATIPCDAPVVFAFFNRDETAVLTAQRETTVAAVEPNLVSKFEFPSNTLQWQTKIPGGSLHGAAYAPEQDQLVVTTDAGVIAAVDCETGAVHRERLPTPAPSVTVLAGTPYVAAGDKAGTVQLRSLLGSEAPNLQFSCVDRGLESLAYSPNERRLVHASRDGTAGLWRVDVGNATRPLRAERIYRHQSPLWCARLDRDGENLVTVDRSGAVTRWGLREPNVQVPRRLHCGDLHAMSRSELACAASGSRRFDVSADCKLAAGASYGDPLRVWDLQSGRQLLEIDGERLRHVFPELAEHGGEPEIVRFVPGNASGSDVLCVSIRGQSVFIDPRSGEPVDYLATGGTINAAYPVWHPSGTVFAVVVVPDMRLEVWNAAENRLVASFDSDVSDVAWSPDGKRLMTGHYAGYAAIYAVDGLKSGAAPWSERVRFVADQEVAYSADGKTIASASTKSVTLWNAATLRKLIELPIPGEFGFEWVTVRFASDGRSLTVEGLTPDSLEQCIWVLGEH